MEWKLYLPILGSIFSFFIMMVLIIKWKLTRLYVLIGAILITIIAALPFLWVYPFCKTSWMLTVSFLAQIALTLTLAFALIMLRFWRDPDRVPPEENNVVVSAADGKVVYVRDVDEGSAPMVTKQGKDYCLTELMGTSLIANSVYVIGVEMTYLDVHVTRCPVDGQVKFQKHIEGKFMSLRKDEAPFMNERLTTVIENEYLPVAIVQVASRLVRCVESHLHLDEKVSIGRRLGMIKFGSLVAIVLPKRDNLKILVKNGDRVKAGESILARYT